MAPAIAMAAAELGKAAIAGDTAVDQTLFAKPSAQTMGQLTVGSKQVGGKGNSAGATSANPATGTNPAGGGLGFFDNLSDNEKMLLVLIGMGLLYITLKK